MMRFPQHIILCLSVLAFCKGYGQKKQSFELRTVAFYNLENLFDTTNDTLVYDDDRTPEGKDGWTQDRYQHKLRQLAEVLPQIGAAKSFPAPDIIGVCEVENAQVLDDLLDMPKLRSQGYAKVHVDAPDERGIDVALIYKKASFTPISFQSRRLLLFKDDGKRDYTRDQLVIEGLLDDETIYILVNHWPSRSGGESRSRPFRKKAAELNKRIIDSILDIAPEAKLISMGDFNDDPTDASMKKILNPSSTLEGADSLGLYNPMERLYRKGQGSLAYRDQWNLFDQIYMTAAMARGKPKGYRFWKAGIYAPLFLMDPKGKYKGYPLRTYAGGAYIGGYSDHFPVYAHFIREVRQ